MYMLQDTGNCKFLWWDDLDISCNETIDAKSGISHWFSDDGTWIPCTASQFDG